MVYVILYLLAIVLANLSVAAFGPSISVLNAFIFIGLDLTARDALHERWSKQNLIRNMALLIAGGSLLSWFLNRDAGQIALASFASFAAAAVVDTAVYRLLDGKARWLKVNGSNVPSAAVDSLIFPALAFGLPLLWPIVLGQFAAKVLGGFVWSLILAAARRFGQRRAKGLEVNA